MDSAWSYYPYIGGKYKVATAALAGWLLQFAQATKQVPHRVFSPVRNGIPGEPLGASIVYGKQHERIRLTSILHLWFSLVAVCC